MSTPLVVSVTDELVAKIQKEFDRNGPCPHFNWNPIGSGDWIHCDDCGQQVGIEYLESAKAASEKHGNLSVALSSILTERAELKRDAERYRWLRLADWWSSPICVVKDPKSQAKPGTDCPTRDRLDAAIDAAMQSEAKP